MPTELDPHGAESRLLLEAADFSQARVLEIGSGDGRLALRYANASAFVVGIEPEEEPLAEARRARPIDLHARLHFVQATAMALPFLDERFHIVVLAWSW